ncbi:MAG: hypothetical protein QJR13_09570, partial [Bacillota bacterium]|nr:hypothetical protein [Bacillota bacterium]
MGAGEERGRRSSSFLWALAASILCHLLLFLLFPSWVPGRPGGQGGLAGGELVRVLFLGQVEGQPPEEQPVEKPAEVLPTP